LRLYSSVADVKRRYNNGEKIFSEATDIKFLKFTFTPEGNWKDTYKLEPKDKRSFNQLGKPINGAIPI